MNGDTSINASGLITGDLKAQLTRHDMVVLEDTTLDNAIVLTRKQAQQLRDWLKEILS